MPPQRSYTVEINDVCVIVPAVFSVYEAVSQNPRIRCSHRATEIAARLRVNVRVWLHLQRCTCVFMMKQRLRRSAPFHCEV